MEIFRRGIVAVIRNPEGLLLLCERSDLPGSWQFPQGGIEGTENSEQTFFRELGEELGNNHCRILSMGNRWVRYRWPELGRDGVSGQEQIWFLGEFLENGEPMLDKSDRCFRAWRWVTVPEALEGVVQWKRPAYEEGLASIGLRTSSSRKTL